MKEKSVATLAILKNYDQTQNIPSQFSHRITELVTLLGRKLKSGFTLELYHLYLLSLFDLFALHFGSLLGFVLILYPNLGYLIGK